MDRVRLSAFPHRLPERRMDTWICAYQTGLARLRGRNPPMWPLRRRYVNSWQTYAAGPGPSRPPARKSPLIFGLASVWNEEDVIWATVRNLLAQGADRVLVIDDGSDDSTRAESEAAGATVLEFSNDGVYSETERTLRIRHVIDEQTREAGGDVWWIVVDADEFPRGPGGTRIRPLVEQLPPWVDTVGSRVLDHLPDGSTPGSFAPRTHPVRWLPLARWYNQPFCPWGHWKHQLFRVRTSGDVYSMIGHHTVGTADGRRAREARESLLMHHVPMRERARTETKLNAIRVPGGRYARAPEEYTRRRLAHRLRILDDVYKGRFDAVPNEYFGERALGIEPRRWHELVIPPERELPAL